MALTNSPGASTIGLCPTPGMMRRRQPGLAVALDVGGGGRQHIPLTPDDEHRLARVRRGGPPPRAHRPDRRSDTRPHASAAPASGARAVAPRNSAAKPVCSELSVMASTERSRSTAGPMTGVQASPASAGISTRSSAAGVSEITTRSTRSGSCSATAIATRPPIEWPTSTACRTPRASSACRTASACPSMPYSAASRGASDPPCPTRSMAITRWPARAARDAVPPLDRRRIPVEQHHRTITRRAGLLDVEVRAVEFEHPSAVERFRRTCGPRYQESVHRQRRDHDDGHYRDDPPFHRPDATGGAPQRANGFPHQSSSGGEVPDHRQAQKRGDANGSAAR